jgi:D-3-phosphoglycerate dehydrogenase
MENIVFEGAQAAVARINLETEPAPALLDRIRTANPNVLELSLILLHAPTKALSETSG